MPSGPSGSGDGIHGGQHGDRLAEDLLDPGVAHDRARELGEDPSDEAHRPGEEVEERDEPDQVDPA